MIQLSEDTQRFILEHQKDDVRSLALQASKYPQVDMPTAITQISGRQIAAEKIPSWKELDTIWYPRHLSMEQCSSELTARYKASLIQGGSLTDLTGGFGIDCAFLAAGFRTATYVERQDDLCEIAAHNFPVLGLSHIHVKNEDGVNYLREMEPVDCIFIDPARRNENGGKIVAIKDCEPDVVELEELLLKKADRVMIKLSPMLDLSQALKELAHTQEVHIISVNNECKELLIVLGKEVIDKVFIHCVNLTSSGAQHFTFTREQERDCECIYAEQIGKYLFEPNASLLKAGAFRILTSSFPIYKLHPNSHLYTSNEPVESFPGRVFRITGQYSLNKKEIKELLADVKKANIAIRNFPSTVDELRKRLKLKDGGSVYLFATTLFNGEKVLVRGEKRSATSTGIILSDQK